MLGVGRPPPQAAGLWLTVDASGPASRVALVRIARIGAAGVRADLLRQDEDAGTEGRPARLAAMVGALIRAERPDALAALVGPGSFTGLRAALALLAGLADAGGWPAIGVTAGEAVFAEHPATRCVATPAGAGRYAVERGFPDPVVTAAAALPADAAPLGPTATGIARAARLRLDGAWPSRALVPLYATPPAAIARPARPAPL